MRTGPRSTPGLLPSVPAVLAVLAVLAGLAGCGSVHSDRRATGADVCAGALPAAQAVAGDAARLSRLRSLNLQQTDDLLADLGATPLQPPGVGTGSPSPRLAGRWCALAYTGSFSAGTLPTTVVRTGGTGPVLLLVVTTRHAHVLRAVVLPALPPALGR